MSNNTRLAELMNYITIDTTSGNQFQMSGSIKQTSVTSALLKADSTGVFTAATAGTDYLTSVGISNLTATGTPSATTYLRGDNTWATVSGGGGGSISTLTDVVITTIANRNLLQYDSGTSKWVNIPNYLLTEITTGSTFVGNSSGNLTLTGTNNTTVGYQAGLSLTTGQSNIAIGSFALTFITTPSFNVAIGYGAGRYIGNGVTNNTTSSSSVFIGQGARPLNNGETNQICIGDGVIGQGANSTTIGNSSCTKALIYGVLSVGNTNFPTISGGAGFQIGESFFITGGLSVSSPFTQSLQVDIQYETWSSGSSCVALVEVDCLTRTQAGLAAAAYGRVYAINTIGTTTFDTVNSTNITTINSTFSASSPSNYKLRLRFTPTNIHDLLGYFIKIPNRVYGAGVNITSISTTVVA